MPPNSTPAFAAHVMIALCALVISFPALADEPRDYTLEPLVHPSEAKSSGPRIVSIAPSITEMCAALGLADQVVGRTQYCNHPDSVAHAAIIGAYADTNFEKILALKPDVILITDSSVKLEQHLERLNLDYTRVPDSTLKDIFTAARRIGDVSGRPKTAELLVSALKEDLQRLGEQSSDHRHERVLITFSSLPQKPQPIYAAGPGSYLDSLVALAGWSNALAGRIERPWARLSVETVLRLKPDYILEVRPTDQEVNMDDLYRGWSALDQIPAISKRQIRSVNDVVSRPGPRINIALHEIMTALSE